MKRNPNIGELIHQRPDLLKWVQGDEPLDGLFDLPSNLDPDRVALYKTLHQGVGHTPVHQLTLPNGARLHLKMESRNAMGGSHYSRYWLPYLFLAESLGAIVPGETHLVEVTSGNSGLTLALASKALGYAVTLLAPHVLSEKRISPIKDAGAEVVVVEGYVKECVGLMRRMLTTGKYFTPNHSEERIDLLVHAMRRISLEYLAEHPSPTAAFAALGNGCSTVGLLKPFMDHHLSTERYVYWPAKDFDRPVVGLMIQEVDLRHIALAKATGHHRQIPGSLPAIMHEVKSTVDLGDLDPGWSTYLGIWLAMQTLAQPQQNGFMVCYDGGARY